jgi:hypothetical protein
MRQLSKRIAALAALLAALTVTGIAGAAAQDATAMPGSACVGTWLLRVTPLGQEASSGFPVNATFHADGTFVTEGAPVSPGPADAPDKVTVMSTAQGVWQPTASGGCAVTHVFYDSDLQGNLVNTVEIRIVLVVGPDGNTMTTEGTDFATVTAADGTVLFSGPGNTVTGTRLVVMLAPTPSPTP